MDQEGKGYRKTYTPSQAKPKIEKFCAYQERSHQQVKRKLQGYGLNGMDADILLVELMHSNFLNEERFAMAYARGKFKIKGWGKAKIKQGLKREGVGEKLIQQALASLGMDDYLDTLNTLTTKKWPLIKGASHIEKVFKLKRYLLGKGYDFEAIDKAIAQVVN
jgi:regulatory protein